MISKQSVIIVLLSSWLCSTVSGFQQGIHQRTTQQLSRLISRFAKTSNDDFPAEEEFSEKYEGSVDWDAEWKKQMQRENAAGSVGVERPGKDYYKSEAEIAAIKAVNKASEKAAKAGAGVANAMPDIRSLSGDWKVRMFLVSEKSRKIRDRFGVSFRRAAGLVPPPISTFFSTNADS